MQYCSQIEYAFIAKGRVTVVCWKPRLIEGISILRLNMPVRNDSLYNWRASLKTVIIITKSNMTAPCWLLISGQVYKCLHNGLLANIKDMWCIWENAAASVAYRLTNIQSSKHIQHFPSILWFIPLISSPKSKMESVLIFNRDGGVVSEGYCVGGTAGGCWATGGPGSGTVVRVARSWLEADGPVPGPLPTAAADFGTAFGGKLIAERYKIKYVQ